MKLFSKKTMLGVTSVFAIALSFTFMSYTSDKMDIKDSTEDQLASSWCQPCANIRASADNIAAVVPPGSAPGDGGMCDQLKWYLASQGSCAWECNIYASDYGCYR